MKLSQLVQWVDRGIKHLVSWNWMEEIHWNDTWASDGVAADFQCSQHSAFLSARWYHLCDAV